LFSSFSKVHSIFNYTAFIFYSALNVSHRALKSTAVLSIFLTVLNSISYSALIFTVRADHHRRGHRHPSLLRPRGPCQELP